MNANVYITSAPITYIYIHIEGEIERVTKKSTPDQ